MSNEISKKLINSLVFMVVFILFLTNLTPANLFAQNSINPIRNQISNASSENGLTEQDYQVIDKYKETPLKVAVYSNPTRSKFIFDLIAKETGLKFTYVSYPSFLDGFNSVKNGECDLMSNLTYTPERVNFVSFSESIDKQDVYLFSKDFNILSNMVDKKIAFEKGTVWASFCKTVFPNSIMVPYSNEHELLKMFENDEIDCVIDADKSYYNLIKSGTYPLDVTDKFTMVTTCIVGVKDEKEDVLEVINNCSKSKDFRNSLTDFKRSYYYDLNKEYLDELLNETEFDKTLEYTFFAAQFSPFVNYVNENEIKGIFNDVINEVSKLTNVKFKLSSSYGENWKYLAQNYEKNGYSMAIPVPYSVENNKLFILTPPVSVSENVIVKKKNTNSFKLTSLSDLVFENIGTVEGSSLNAYISKSFPKKEIKRYESTEKLVAAIKNDEIDYAPINQFEFFNYVNTTKDIQVRICEEIPPFRSDDLCFAFKKDRQGFLLSQIFSTSCRMIDLRHINSNYMLQTSYEDVYKKQAQIVWLIVCFVFLFTFTLLFMFLRVRYKSRRDVLCGCYNRTALIQDYKNGISEKETIILMDLNKFKEINDVYGHRAGDQVLKAFANAYEGNDKIKFYRTGGDEFVVIADFNKCKISIEDYTNLFVDKIIEIEETNLNFTISASIGILPGKYKVGDFYKTMSIVDVAMYEAKEKHQIKTYIDGEKLEEYVTQVNFRFELEDAIKNGEVIAHFQPIIHLESNKVVGFETLSRWKRNGKFIPVKQYLAEAKKIGIEAKIDENSLIWAKKLFDKTKDISCFCVCVNFSHQGLIKVSKGEIELSKYKIPKDLFKFEILEDMIVDYECFEDIKKISDSGYKISIDDFGASYTSFEHLKENMFSAIKIHKSLVPVDFSESDNANKVKTVLESQIRMLNNMNKLVVVEGVETKEQLDYLKTIGATYIQGFYYSKALPLDEAIKFAVEFNKE